MYGFDLKKTDRKKNTLLILQWRLQYPTSRHRALPIHICQYHLESLSSSRDLFTESVAPRKPIGSRLESRWRVASSHFVYSHFVEAILKSFIISIDQILIGNRNLFRFIKVKVIRCSFFCNKLRKSWYQAMTSCLGIEGDCSATRFDISTYKAMCEWV